MGSRVRRSEYSVFHSLLPSMKHPCETPLRARLSRLATFAAFLTVLSSLPTSGAGAPNLLIFYADDLGWGELGCQGNKEIPTPNIDAIAKNGIRFTQGYVAATYCSPSRAGLDDGPLSRRDLATSSTASPTPRDSACRTTMADRLKRLGYATACVGKWHLGGGTATGRRSAGSMNSTARWPIHRIYHPTNFVDSRISNDVQKVTDDSFYTTDKYADRSARMARPTQGRSVVPLSRFQRPARSIGSTEEISRSLSRNHGRKTKAVCRDDGREWTTQSGASWRKFAPWDRRRTRSCFSFRTTVDRPQSTTS